MKYPLIQKWLGLKVVYTDSNHNYIVADDLEAKLAEGFEVYADEGTSFSNCQLGNTHALAIGKQPIKKKTREEAALEFIQWISEGIYPRDVTEKAKEILEMK